MPAYTAYEATGEPMLRFTAETAYDPPTDVVALNDKSAPLIDWVKSVLHRDPNRSVLGIAQHMGYDSFLARDDGEEEPPPPSEEELAAKASAKFRKRVSDIRDEFAGDEIEKSDVYDTHDVILKADNEQKIVYGWAYVTHDKDGQVVVDKSGEFVDDIEEIEKTAVRFMLESRKGDVDHTNVHKTDIVESMVFTPDKMAAMGIAKGTMPSGWWIGVKCNDEVWADYKAGKYTSFSIHGKGVRKQVTDGE